MNNGIRTAGLMALLMVVFVLIGNALGGQGGMMIALVLALVMNFGSYWFSDKIVLRMYRAVEVSRDDARDLYDMVDRLRTAAGLPMPRVYVIPSDQPNAFATGRNPAHAAVAVTNGIISALDPDQLEGVIAHELAHVKNRDILTSSIAAAMATGITVIARFGIFFGGNRDRGGAVSSILLLVLAPIAAMLIQMAISRTREFSADRDGAAICGKPAALAGALGRLEEAAGRSPMQASPSTAHMFIVNPFSGKMANIARLFSTHPPTSERIARLMEMERLRRG